MSEQVRVTPEQARQLISKTHGRPTPSNTVAITDVRTRSEELREGGTLGIPVVILSGTSTEPHQIVYFLDVGGHTLGNVRSNEFAQWTKLVPSLNRGEHVITARVLVDGQFISSEPWRLYVAVGDRIQFSGLAGRDIAVTIPCGEPCPALTNEPVGQAFLHISGEVGTQFRIANTGESPEPPPPGSLLWGPVQTLSTHTTSILDSRLGTPPVHNWYHIRTEDLGPLTVAKCLGNFVRTD